MISANHEFSCRDQLLGGAVNLRNICLPSLLWQAFASLLLIMSERALCYQENPGPPILSAQRLAEQRIEAIVSGFDQDALVFVSFTPPTVADVRLPGTPFVAKSITLGQNRSSSQYVSALITVLTRSGNISTAAKNAITLAMKPFAIEVAIEEQRLPEGYESPRNKQQNQRKTELAEQRSWDERVRKEQQKWLAQQEATRLEELRKNSRQDSTRFEDLRKVLSQDGVSKEIPKIMRSGLTKLDKFGENLRWSAFVLAAFSLFVLGLFGITHVRKSKSMGEYASKISEAIGGISIGASAPAALGFEASSGRAGAHEPARASAAESDSDREALAELSKASIISLMTDCYWAEQDQYAAYLWKRLSIPRRNEVCREVPYLSEYAKFVAALGEQNLNMAQHPYYLDPLVLTHVSQDDLTVAIRKNPEILTRLSPIRLDNLRLSAIERITLEQQAESSGRTIDALNLLPSKLRVAKRRNKIRVASVDEEKALAKMSDLPISFKEATISWVWSRALTDEELRSVLEKFGARELAGAWVAPTEILERMLQHLPARKRDLVLSLIARQVPSRNQTHEAVHNEIISYIRGKELPAGLPKILPNAG